MADKEGMPNGIVFGDSQNYQVLEDFEFQNKNELGPENDNDGASDASYSTNNSKELLSNLKLPRSFENVEDLELESISGSIEDDKQDDNNNEERELNNNEEPGVDNNEEPQLINNPDNFMETGVVSDLDNSNDNISHETEIEHSKCKDNDSTNNEEEEHFNHCVKNETDNEKQKYNTLE